MREAGRSGEHLSSLDGLEHGPEIVTVRLRELDVCLERPAVQSFGLCDFLAAFGKRRGKVAPGQFDHKAPGFERPGASVAVLK